MMSEATAYPALWLHEVSRAYQQGETPLVILDKAELALWPGQSVALVAPSGAGKSTLLHIAGLLECPAGHGQPPGSKFCNECGAPMSAPVTKAALDAPPRPAEPPAAAPSPSHRPMPARLQDLRHDELQAACRARGLDADGVRKVLMKRLRTAGVTNADLQALLVAA